jgi:hypothetical protein
MSMQFSKGLRLWAYRPSDADEISFH